MKMMVDSKLLLDCLKKELPHYLSALRCKAILLSKSFKTILISKESVANMTFIFANFGSWGMRAKSSHSNISPRIVMLLQAIAPLVTFPTGALSKPLDG